MNSDVAGLVERLDSLIVDDPPGGNGFRVDPAIEVRDVVNAASTIRALVAKNERLKAKAEVAEGVGNELYRGAMDKLRAAVELLIEAPVAPSCDWKCGDGTSHGPCNCGVRAWDDRRTAFLATMEKTDGA